MTNIIHIYPPVESFLQNNSSLNPGNNIPDNFIKQHMIEHFLHNADETFRLFRTDFIKPFSRRKQRHWRSLVKKLKIKTNASDTQKVPIVNDKYDFFHSYHKGKSTVKIGEPIMENPCSYNSVEKSLKHIQGNATNEERKVQIVYRTSQTSTLNLLDAVSYCQLKRKGRKKLPWMHWLTLGTAWSSSTSLWKPYQE